MFGGGIGSFGSVGREGCWAGCWNISSAKIRMLIISLMVNGYRLAPDNLKLVIEREAIPIPCVS
jgi:hypothetical protein